MHKDTKVFCIYVASIIAGILVTLALELYK